MISTTDLRNKYKYFSDNQTLIRFFKERNIEPCEVKKMPQKTYFWDYEAEQTFKEHVEGK